MWGMLAQSVLFKGQLFTDTIQETGRIWDSKTEEG